MGGMVSDDAVLKGEVEHASRTEHWDHQIYQMFIMTISLNLKGNYNGNFCFMV